MSNTRVGRLLEEQGSVVFPGVYDTLSAKLVERLGFPLSFISGYSVAASGIGEPDMGLLTQTEMLETARNVCRSIDIPIIVDADTGYGNPLNVIRTVETLIEAGAAGCFLEDQLWPKKCGHMRGKRVIDRDEYLQKIRAASEVRAGGDFFIVSRTDALAAVSLEEAMVRMEEAQIAGADASFVEAPGSIEDLEQIGKFAPRPSVVNMIEGGKTPILPLAQLTEFGFQLILHPLAGLFAAAYGMREIFRRLKEEGTTLGGEGRLMAFAEFNELIGVEEKYALGEKFGVE